MNESCFTPFVQGTVYVLLKQNTVSAWDYRASLDPHPTDDPRPSEQKT